MMNWLFLLVFVPYVAYGADNVEIFGEANTASGKKDEAYFSFEEENPPVVEEIIEQPQASATQKKAPAEKDIENLHEVNQWSPQNPKPFSISPEKEQNEIENTLYEGGNRIYDVQSFPIKDIKTITEPNIDPTISTYPEY